MEKEENLNQEKTSAETPNENKEVNKQLDDKQEEIEGVEENIGKLKIYCQKILKLTQHLNLSSRVQGKMV